MPEFVFRSADRDNRITEGRMVAGDAAAVAERLHALGRTPLRIAEAAAGARGASALASVRRRRGLSRRSLGELFLELRLLLRSGIDLARALAFMARSARDQGTRDIVKAVHESVEKGGMLSEALGQADPAIPAFLLATIRAGESSGQLETVLDRLGGYMERREKLRAELLSALIYPAILLVLSAVAVVILMTVLIPGFRPLFEDAGVELPAITQFVLLVSDLATRHGLAALAAGAALSATLYLALKDETRWLAWERAKLRLPFLIGGLNQKIQVTIFARLMGLLLENGVILHEALALAREAAPNRAFGAALGDARQKVREGQKLSDALAPSRLFPGLSLDLLRIGEEASNVTGSLVRIADLYEAEVERALKRLMDLFVPVLTVVLGIVIATVIFSVLFAMLSLNDLALR